MLSKGTNIVSVLPNIHAYFPNTKDSRSYMKSSLNRKRPLRYGIVHEGYPWDELEGGLGFHAMGVDEGLASYILRLGRELLGKIWETPHDS